MSVISRQNKHILGTKTAALLVFLVTILFQAQLHSVCGSIVITMKEEQCLEQTGRLFVGANDDLIIARQEFTAAMEMEMTSDEKMYAKYPEDKLKNYEVYCSKYGGKMHIIKIDFFDCILRGSPTDIELTLKNFANCMAKIEECEGFGQEHLLQEAWGELGLDCILEEEETKKDPPKSNDNNVDDDIAKKRKGGGSRRCRRCRPGREEHRVRSEGRPGQNRKEEEEGGRSPELRPFRESLWDGIFRL